MNIVTHRLIFNKYRGPTHYRQRPGGGGASQLGWRFKDTGLRPRNFVCMQAGNTVINISQPAPCDTVLTWVKRQISAKPNEYGCSKLLKT